ncbi:MAG: hypothetical protein ACRDB0_07770 [Paraclostridium sp.]
MGIKIENFEHVTDPTIKQREVQLDKEKYITFLIENGLAECFKISETYKQLKELLEVNALGNAIHNRNELKNIESNIFYYDNIMPALITGDYRSVETYSDLSADELKTTSRELRRQMIGLLDDKYGHLYK